MNGEPLLEARKLSKSFAGVKAVVDVDWVVRPGEIWGVVGPNGSGKTTLFNTLSGFHRHTGGTVLFEGRDLGNLRMRGRARRGLIRTFQHAEVFSTLTVEENLVVAGRTPRRDRASVMESLASIGLAGVAAAPAGKISFGKRRQLGVAMAAATRPTMLLLDEPTSGLNDAEAEELSGYLRSLNRNGLTIAIVDHHMDFLLPLCERMLLLRSGHKLWEGSADAFQESQIVIDTYLGRQSHNLAQQESEAAGRA